MSKFVRMAAMVSVAALLGLASLEARAFEGGQGMGQPSEKDQQYRKEEEALRFKNKKEEMTLMMDHRLSEIKEREAEVEKAKSCVQSAADFEALRACMPEKHGGGRGMGGPQGGQGMGSPQGMGGHDGGEGRHGGFGGGERGERRGPGGFGGGQGMGGPQGGPPQGGKE